MVVLGLVSESGISRYTLKARWGKNTADEWMAIQVDQVDC